MCNTHLSSQESAIICLFVVLAAASAQMPSWPMSFGQQPRVSLIYNNGALQKTWKSWSWGLSYQNFADLERAAEGSAAGSLCITIRPFGALSLRSQSHFETEFSTLGFYFRGAGKDEAVAGLANLELQLETSTEAGYSISHSVSFKELMMDQAVNGTNASLLAAAAAGEWIPVRAPLASLSPPQSFDRITLGHCLQNMGACEHAVDEAISICLDHLFIVSPAAMDE